MSSETKKKIDTMPSEELMAKYREEWIKRGLCCDPMPRDESVILAFCKQVLKRDEMETVIWADGPKDAWEKTVDASLKEEEIAEAEIPEIRESLLKQFIWPTFAGQFEAGWIGYFTFMRDEMGVEGFSPLFDVAAKMVDYGPIYPLTKHCIVMDRPKAIRMIESSNTHVLHADCKPSVEYRDGSKTYHLNGVNVPEWLAMTPDTKIDTKKFAEIDNVEVRREFVRKVGIERIVGECDMELTDERDEYQLYKIDLGGDVGKWPVLKMENPSLPGVYHMEFVDENCETVKDALTFRNGADIEPRQKT